MKKEFISEVRGTNYYRNSIHAEINCLHKTNLKPHKKYTLHIYHYAPDGSYRNAHPCMSCVNEILKHSRNISHVVYSNEHGTLTKVNLSTLLIDGKRYQCIGDKIKRGNFK